MWISGQFFGTETVSRIREEVEREPSLSRRALSRRANLQHVVCNSRFLIVPTVRVPNPASQLLSRCVCRLGADWEYLEAITAAYTIFKSVPGATAGP